MILKDLEKQQESVLRKKLFSNFPKNAVALLGQGDLTLPFFPQSRSTSTRPEERSAHLLACMQGVQGVRSDCSHNPA